MVEFGKEFRKKYFSLLEEDITPLNHGSYGLTPTPVMDAYKKAAENHEHYPDEFYMISAHDEYVKQLKTIGDYLNIKYNNIAFVTNATTGVNTVLRSIPFDFKKDRALFHSTTYGACGNVVRYLHDYHGLEYDVVDLQYPLTDDEVIALFEEKLSTKQYKICMFDMISSMPGVKVPYERLIKLCKKYNTWSLIDGAHAAGMCDMSFIDKLEPDFLTTNLHKWLFVPKSCGLLYVNPKHHKMIQTFPVSWSYKCDEENSEINDDNIMIEKFWFYGTAAYPHIHATSAAIEFRRDVCGGESKIREYQIQLKEKAIKSIKEILGSDAELLDNAEKTLAVPGLFDISFPIEKKYVKVIDDMEKDEKNYLNFKAFSHKHMIEKYKTYAPTIYHNGKLWLRFSVNVYNSEDDYKEPIHLLKKAINESLEHFL